MIRSDTLTTKQKPANRASVLDGNQDGSVENGGKGMGGSHDTNLKLLKLDRQSTLNKKSRTSAKRGLALENKDGDGESSQDLSDEEQKTDNASNAKVTGQ